MPEKLDRCVMHVMGQGHDESSAYAICRASLGLKLDGSEDGKPLELTDEEVRVRADNEISRRRFANGPTYRKKMVVCTPFGEYVNGPDEGEMTPARLRRLAENFRRYRRQVPVFALGDHEFDRDARLPDGWVEGLEYEESRDGYPSGALIADVKVQGDAAQIVLGDLVRGASIGTVQGKNPDGTPQGEVLDHVLLTNNPFDKTVNIAAARKGAEPIASFFTALNKEAAMAEKTQLEKLQAEMDEKDDLIADLRKQIEDLKKQLEGGGDEGMKAQLKAAESLVETKSREVTELRAKNENLEREVKTLQKNPDVEQAKLRIASLERVNKAEKIRRLVGQGVNEGRFNLALVGEASEGWNNQSDEVVLTWFKTSEFKDSMDRLEFALKTLERKPVNQKFTSGRPDIGSGEPVLTDEQRTYLRKRGIDPDVVLAGMKAQNAQEFKQLTAK